MRSKLPAIVSRDTERLHLRPPGEQDADAIIGIVSDWEVARRLGRIPLPYTGADLCYFLDQVVPNEPTWAIVWRENCRLIGIIGLVPARTGDSAELGYYVARDCWGRGIATEAAREIIKLGFDCYGYSKLTAGYHEDNPASGRVLAKLGFVVAGTSIRPCLAAGTDKPCVDMECLR